MSGLRLSLFLGWQDIRLMYRRSVLGQFWITLSMAITFAAIGLVFGLIFNTTIQTYLPYLGCGLVLFNLLSLLTSEGTNSFIAADSFIRQLPLSPLIYFGRTIWRTCFIFAHNFVALIILLIVIPQGVSFATLLFVPGMLISVTAMSGLALALAMLATRYRDIPQIVASVLGVAFYVTPIVWLPETLPEQARNLVLTWNPFHHLIVVMREPLLNQYPSPAAWLTAIGLAIAFVSLGLASYAWKRRQLAFWM
jgi:lipopolysaccharide transport system permease protein